MLTQNEWKDFETINADTRKLLKVQADINSLTEGLAKAENEVAGLRPGIKNYENLSQKLGVQVQAMKMQLSSSKSELVEAVKELKRDALQNRCAELLDGLNDSIREKDVEIIKALIKVKELATERGELSDTMNARSSVLEQFKYQLSPEFDGAGIRRPKLPWGSDWGNVAGCLEGYLGRFSRFCNQTPPAGATDDEVLAWLSRR